jgi:hypothetical protein
MINHWVTITRKNRKPIGVQIIREGPIVVMVTTARDNLDNETRTRLISTKADESHGQTVKVVKQIFATPINPVTQAEFEKWLAFQRWLAIDGPYTVLIPFSDAISETFGMTDVPFETVREYPLRARRDATALRAAIGASAILHKAQREVDGNGRLIATIADYKLAHAVIDPSAAEDHHVAIPDTALAVVQAIERLGASKSLAAKVTTRGLAVELGISSTSTAAGRLIDALDAQLIEIAAKPNGTLYQERKPRYYKILMDSVEKKYDRLGEEDQRLSDRRRSGRKNKKY